MVSEALFSVDTELTTTTTELCDVDHTCSELGRYGTKNNALTWSFGVF